VCGRKLFYSQKDAELHGEDTGLSDFAQVSLTEKVWVCKETGKVCFNETQMDLHKKRVPEAQTFDEKTVADLREAEKQRAAGSSDDVEMETEEDALLRAAGKMPKGKGKAKPSGPPVLTKEVIEQLVEMGTRALSARPSRPRPMLARAQCWPAPHAGARPTPARHRVRAARHARPRLTARAPRRRQASRRTAP
jgi:hypothetical protein